jgi:hypothetical protein
MSTDALIGEEPEFWYMGPPSEAPNLGRIAHEAIVAAMVEWFFNNFEDPVHRTPHDEGEYVWIWGGPYDARDELEIAFDGYSERFINAAVERIEEDGLSEWAPSSSRMRPETDEPNKAA